jgi:hypothetical protein
MWTAFVFRLVVRWGMDTKSRDVLMKALPQCGSLLELNGEQLYKTCDPEPLHFWAIDRLDDAIRLLTGMDPGEHQEDGSYPEGTFNFLKHISQTRITRVTDAINPD